MPNFTAKNSKNIKYLSDSCNLKLIPSFLENFLKINPVTVIINKIAVKLK